MDFSLILISKFLIIVLLSFSWKKKHSLPSFLSAGVHNKFCVKEPGNDFQRVAEEEDEDYREGDPG